MKNVKLNVVRKSIVILTSLLFLSIFVFPAGAEVPCNEGGLLPPGTTGQLIYSVTGCGLNCSIFSHPGTVLFTNVYGSCGDNQQQHTCAFYLTPCKPYVYPCGVSTCPSVIGDWKLDLIGEVRNGESLIMRWGSYKTGSPREGGPCTITDCNSPLVFDESGCLCSCPVLEDCLIENCQTQNETSCECECPEGLERVQNQQSQYVCVATEEGHVFNPNTCGSCDFAEQFQIDGEMMFPWISYPLEGVINPNDMGYGNPTNMSNVQWVCGWGYYDTEKKVMEISDSFYWYSEIMQSLNTEGCPKIKLNIEHEITMEVWIIEGTWVYFSGHKDGVDSCAGISVDYSASGYIGIGEVPPQGIKSKGVKYNPRGSGMKSGRSIVRGGRVERP